MYRQRRAVERIVTAEVMRLERRQRADALAPAERRRSDRPPVVRRRVPRPSP